MDNNNTMKEKLYFDLRSEIKDKVNRIENMSTFCVTTMITVFAFVFKEENIPNELLLLPIIPIVMLSFRAMLNRKQIIKISEYIKAKKLECSGAEWEKDNSTKIDKLPKYLDFSILTVLTMFVYYYQNNFDFCANPLITVISAIAAIIEIVITYKLNSISKLRNECKKEFEQES